ncbi:MAG: acyl carrier protein [Acidobacteria bacterium]|nr:acyl carrier protein [Acidobacteriota bacterium]
METIKQLFISLSDADPASIDWAATFEELPGWDSMRAVNFQIELESQFGVDLSDVDSIGSLNLSTLADLLRSKGTSLDN